MKSIDVYDSIKINNLCLVKDYREKVDKWETWEMFAIALLIRDYNIQETEGIPAIQKKKRLETQQKIGHYS